MEDGILWSGPAIAFDPSPAEHANGRLTKRHGLNSTDNDRNRIDEVVLRPDDGRRMSADEWANNDIEGRGFDARSVSGSNLLGRT